MDSRLNHAGRTTGETPQPEVESGEGLDASNAIF
jgi:hypothetical protein